jgi:general secretion pathway protein I
MKRRGFTLLEMLVASTIMAVAIVGLFSGIGGAARNAARLRDYDRATQLSRMKMNELLADQNMGMSAERNGIFDQSLTGGLDVQWQARLTTVEMPPTVSMGQPCLQRIQLQISWTAGSQQRTFTLDSFRTHILRNGDL